MIVQLTAGLVLLALLWSLFRFAIGLRASKLSREEARRAEELRGRRVVAEIPGPGGDLALFLEDDEGFYWGAADARKREIAAARVLLNGSAVATTGRSGAALPGPAPAAEYDGKERWEVVLDLAGGGRRAIPCGSLREGVSREVALTVFSAVRRCLPGSEDDATGRGPA